MNDATVQLILALLPVAEKLIFEVGGKLIEISTSDLSDPEKIRGALEKARDEGFPQLKFHTPEPASAPNRRPAADG